jgi:hypothetical protein
MPMMRVKRVTSEPSRRAHAVLSACWPTGLVVAAALSVLPAVAQTSPAATQAFENAKFHYNVSLPVGCRHDEGPGTLEAVCSPGFDPEKSATASAAASMVLEVSAEVVAGDIGKPPAELAQGYTEAQFKAHLPESVCGESDRARVKIAEVSQVFEDARVVYRANVVCSEIKFLGLGERRAAVQYLITPGLRYRLMARAPQDDFERKKASIDAFLASFRLTSAR